MTPEAKQTPTTAQEAPATILAYKGFNQDWTCRGYQYEVGGTYTHDGDVEACSGGFHACENPLDVWSYYGPAESRFALVEMSGEISRHGDDSKIASGKITIKAELALPQIITDGVRYLMDLCKDAFALKDQVGEMIQAASGDGSQLAASGDDSQLAASGYASQLAASGNASQLAASGNGSKLAASGYDSICVAAGLGAMAKAGKGGVIALAEHDGQRNRIVIGYVGEAGIEADTWYCAKGGKLVEVEQ